MRLIMTDIDGTILPWGDQVVPEETRQAIREAQAAGCVVGPASGRARQWIAPFFEGEEECYGTCIAVNGLEVWVDGELALKKTMDSAALERVAEVLSEVPGAGLLCFVGGDPILVTGERADLSAAFPRYGAICSEGPVPAGAVEKANVFVNGDLAETRSVVARFNDEVNGLDFDVAQPGFSNVMPAGWNKGQALLWLRDRLGVAPEDVFVFGDAGNDLALFAATENSVAVANALPEAAAAARWHIGPVQEGSMAAAIRALAAGEFPFSE